MLVTDLPRVLHVLPHPGGGGERYVDALAQMDGFVFEKVFIAPTAAPQPAVLSGALHANLRGTRFDLLHAHGEVASTLCLPVLAARPSVVTLHGLNVVRRLDGWRASLAKANLRLIARMASEVICVSESEFADVNAIVRLRNNVTLVRNGIESSPRPTASDRETARIALGVGSTELVGLFVGALEQHKEPLLAASAALRAAKAGLPITVLFAGEGPLRPNLEALALESAAIRVLGFSRNITQVLAAADFFVLPSAHEGLSLALLEAMAMGVSPVVSDAPGNLDAVGEAGLIVARGDREGFTAAYARLADASLRSELSQRARARVVAMFRLDEMVEATRRIYGLALEPGRRRVRDTTR